MFYRPAAEGKLGGCESPGRSRNWAGNWNRLKGMVCRFMFAEGRERRFGIVGVAEGREGVGGGRREVFPWRVSTWARAKAEIDNEGFCGLVSDLGLVLGEKLLLVAMEYISNCL